MGGRQWQVLLVGVFLCFFVSSLKAHQRLCVQVRTAFGLWERVSDNATGASAPPASVQAVVGVSAAPPGDAAALKTGPGRVSAVNRAIRGHMKSGGFDTVAKAAGLSPRGEDRASVGTTEPRFSGANQISSLQSPDKLAGFTLNFVCTRLVIGRALRRTSKIELNLEIRLHPRRLKEEINI